MFIIKKVKNSNFFYNKLSLFYGLNSIKIFFYFKMNTKYLDK